MYEVQCSRPTTSKLNFSFSKRQNKILNLPMKSVHLILSACTKVVWNASKLGRRQCGFWPACFWPFDQYNICSQCPKQARVCTRAFKWDLQSQLVPKSEQPSRVMCTLSQLKPLFHVPKTICLKETCQGCTLFTFKTTLVHFSNPAVRRLQETHSEVHPVNFTKS